MESATTTQQPGRSGTLEPAHVPEALRVPHRAGERSIAAILRDYVALTKPRIISLLLLTTVTTMIVADPSGPALSVVLWTMLGGYLAAGGAGAINHYLDRDRDARMARTRGRPLVSGRIEPWHGLAFGIALGALATVQLAITVNVLSALLALAGLLGYVFVYTIWLKPLTPQNIVIGGAAGAMPPLVGWAAATGGLAPEALYPFGIVFLWTPPALLGAVAADQGRLRAHGRADAPRGQGRGGHAPPDRRLRPGPGRVHAAPGRNRVPRRVVPGRGARPRWLLRGARRPAVAHAVAARRAAPLPLLARVPRPALLRDGPGPGHLIEPRPWIAAERPATSERGF